MLEETNKIPKLPSTEQINEGKKPEEPPKSEPTIQQDQPVQGMVQIGEGLPALPPKPPAPIRQALPSASINSTNIMRQRVPNVNQATKPQINIPPGSDLGLVGKLGAYQIAHKTPVSAAVDVHANILFWFYAIIMLTTFIVMKRRN